MIGMTAAEKLSVALGSPMVEFALDYARRGWPVFPCRPTNKTPYIKGGHNSATTDPETIRQWWTEYPRAMIGVPMGSRSGVWAIDPDPPKKDGEPDGRVLWAELVEKHGKVPPTHKEVTPRGGRHILFAWDPQRPVTDSPGALKGQNIDVRGEGGYVIVAPSISVGDGGKNVAGEYCVVEPLVFFSFATAPDWLYEMVLQPEPQAAPAAVVPLNFSNAKRQSGRLFAPDEFWRKVNSLAFDMLGSWVTDIFPHARFQRGTGAYRISSRDLGRDLEEDLSIAPSGIVDFGVADMGDPRLGKRTPIDIVIKYGGKRDATEAALWLCDRCGVDPATLGWRAESKLATAEAVIAETEQPPSVIELFWHGKQYGRELRTWLIQDLIPETGKGLASGQWGAAKTFCMIDLGASVMSGTAFAGRQVVRRGGVLFVAAEGATEIPIRLQGLVEHKLRPALANTAAGAPFPVDLEALPFAWIEEAPDLKDGHSFNRLLEGAKGAGQHLKEQFDLPLALIIIDTLSAAANFKDGNDSAEGQFIMNRLNELGRATGAFVLAVDHFGKAVETGTRDTSAKEGAADVVLALLADRDVNGTISNTRMALRKLRGGKTGAETPFDLKTVDLGNGDTTCIIDWKAEQATGPASTSKKDRWPKTLRMFRTALTVAVVEHGKTNRPYGNDGPALRTAPASAVRDEFVKSYPGDTDAKRMAFKRALKAAREKELICSREIGGIDHLWLVEQDNPNTHANEQNTP